MAGENRKQDMGSGSIPRLMLNLAVPAVIAQLINMLYNIVDRIYIGHIPDAGASALTGVGLFLPILMMINAFAMLAGSSRSRVFRPLRKQSTHTALTAWLITVATAAPCTPMRNPKIRMGSRMMLQTAPTTVVIMLNLAKPWVVMNGFSPITIITKTVPRI